MEVKLLGSDEDTLFRIKSIKLARLALQTPLGVYYQALHQAPLKEVRAGGVTEFYLEVDLRSDLGSKKEVITKRALSVRRKRDEIEKNHGGNARPSATYDQDRYWRRLQENCPYN